MCSEKVQNIKSDYTSDPIYTGFHSIAIIEVNSKPGEFQKSLQSVINWAENVIHGSHT